ncbi:MAG: 50S ribosomal protein L18 [Parcubacteria group bacterium]|jgi:large subunit ribosomal protein L18
MIIDRKKLREKRKRRIRAKIFGTAKRPRLCVFISLKKVYVQAIDDKKGNTIVSADLKEAKGKNNIEGLRKLGKVVAKKCIDKKISEVVFDRGGYKYHGKIKAFADSAREGGLKF